LIEVLKKVLFHRQWIGRSGVSMDWLTFLVDNKLGEVPLDGVHQESGLLHLEILPQRMSCIPVHVDLAEKIKLRSILALCKLLDFFIGSRFLIPELIAGKCQYLQSLLLSILLMQLDQFSVVAVRGTSFGRHVDNDANMTLEFFQLNGIAVDVIGRELVNAFRVLPTFVRHDSNRRCRAFRFGLDWSV